MKIDDDGGPAYPNRVGLGWKDRQGMTLRDSILANGPWDASSIMELHRGEKIDYLGFQQLIVDANSTYADKVIARKRRTE